MPKIRSRKQQKAFFARIMLGDIVLTPKTKMVGRIIKIDKKGFHISVKDEPNIKVNVITKSKPMVLLKKSAKK